jgi:hypothetical protein
MPDTCINSDYQTKFIYHIEQSNNILLHFSIAELIKYIE